jgi:isohexenylglutaconyl-CoA hydratase
MSLPVTETLLLRDRGFALHITLNRPDSRNSMSLQMTQELRAVFSAIEHHPTIRVVILRGSRSFLCRCGTLKTC